MPDTSFFNMPAPPCARLLGWRIEEYDEARSWIRIAFDGKDDFLNPAGFIQGGIQTAMLDDTMGPAVWVKSRGTLYTATINLSVCFLAPARPGPLFGEATVIQIGKTVAFVESRLLDAEGTLLARATASARVVPATRLPA
ncbi:MAG: PaaI family thioesterase [Parvibaculum sp.]